MISGRTEANEKGEKRCPQPLDDNEGQEKRNKIKQRSSKGSKRIKMQKNKIGLHCERKPSREITAASFQGGLKGKRYTQKSLKRENTKKSRRRRDHRAGTKS